MIGCEGIILFGSDQEDPNIKPPLAQRILQDNLMVKDELAVRRLGDLWRDELRIVLEDHVARKFNIEID